MQGPTTDNAPLALLRAQLGLAASSGEKLRDAVRHAGFRAGEALTIEEGDVDNEILLILEGAARLERHAEGLTIAISDLGPGDVAGEADLLLGDAGTDRIVAAGTVEALCISRTALEKAAADPAAEPVPRALRLRSKAARLGAATPLSRLDSWALPELAGRVEEERALRGPAVGTTGGRDGGRPLRPRPGWRRGGRQCRPTGGRPG